MTNTAIRLEDLLFPDTVDITSFEADDSGNLLSIEAETLTARAPCPDCGTLSQRVHGTYRRHPADLPAAGRTVRLSLLVRRFCCQDPACPRRTFAEQVPGLTRRHGRSHPSATYSDILTGRSSPRPRPIPHPRIGGDRVPLGRGSVRARHFALRTLEQVIPGRRGSTPRADLLRSLLGLLRLGGRGGVRLS